MAETLHVLRELKDKLGHEIESAVQEGTLNAATMEQLDKAVGIIKDIETIEAMKEYDTGYSGRYSEDYDYSMGRGGRYGGGRNRNSYGNSYGYSMDSEKDKMIRKYEDLYEKATDPMERETLSRIINQMR